MEKDNAKPILKFEPGSRQPFILYLISITIISAVIVIVCLFTSGISFSDKSDELLGDINFDGTIDTADVILLSSYLTGNKKFDEKQMVAADVDNNGEINSKDSILIMQHLNTQDGSTTEPSEEELPIESTTVAAITDSTDSTDVTQNTSTAEESTAQPEQTVQPDVDFVNSGKSSDAAFLTSESGIYYIARISNSWQASNGRYMYQIDFTTKNNSPKTMYNTSAKVNLSDDVMIEKNWNCSAKNESGVVTVTTKNEGRTMSGGTFKCGFIISAGSPITIESVTK